MSWIISGQRWVSSLFDSSPFMYMLSVTWLFCDKSVLINCKSRSGPGDWRPTAAVSQHWRMSSLRISPSSLHLRFSLGLNVFCLLFFWAVHECFSVWKKNKIQQQQSEAVCRLVVGWGGGGVGWDDRVCLCEWGPLLTAPVHRCFLFAITVLFVLRSFVTCLLVLFFLFRVTLLLLFKNKKWSSFPFYFSGVLEDTWLTRYLNPHVRWWDFIFQICKRAIKS